LNTANVACGATLRNINVEVGQRTVGVDLANASGAAPLANASGAAPLGAVMNHLIAAIAAVGGNATNAVGHL